MKKHLVLLILAAAAVSFAGCATNRGSAQTPPAANDWTTEYVGKGPVTTSITNDSGSSLFLKVRSAGATAAQVQLGQGGTRDVFLSPADYGIVMMLTAQSGHSYYRGPGFNIPPNAAHISLTLQPADTTNLTPISKEEFER